MNKHPYCFDPSKGTEIEWLRSSSILTWDSLSHPQQTVWSWPGVYSRIPAPRSSSVIKAQSMMSLWTRMEPSLHLPRKILPSDCGTIMLRLSPIFWKGIRLQSRAFSSIAMDHIYSRLQMTRLLKCGLSLRGSLYRLWRDILTGSVKRNSLMMLEW